MTYAPDHRPYYDADSHIMELPDFLRAYADPAIRDEIPLVDYTASIVTDEEVAEIVDQGNRHSDEHRAAQIALGDDLIANSKEIQGLGAFDSADRTTAMDLLGFKKQLVFATHSVVTPFHPSSNYPLRLKYGGARAHNRHMAAFCAEDDRLMGVGVVALDDAARAVEEVEWAIEAGLEAIWVPHRAPIGMSPGHVDLEPFWARLAEAGVPFVIHVGGAPLHASKAWSNNGRAKTRDWMGGGENVRTKDAMLMHQNPEAFISMLIATVSLIGIPTCAVQRSSSVRGGCRRCSVASTRWRAFSVASTKACDSNDGRRSSSPNKWGSPPSRTKMSLD